jgi:hypothetical protein
MSVDWTQPYVLIFEWGLFIFGWLLVVVLSSIVLAISYAAVKALVMTLLGKKSSRAKASPEAKPLKVKRDVYGRFVL